MDSLITQVNDARDEAKAAQRDVETLKAKLTAKNAAPVTSNDKALQEKVKELEKKRGSLEAALAEWTELAKV